MSSFHCTNTISCAYNIKSLEELIAFIHGREMISIKLCTVREVFSGEYSRKKALELFDFPDGTETSELTLVAQVEDIRKGNSLPYAY